MNTEKECMSVENGSYVFQLFPWFSPIHPNDLKQVASQILNFRSEHVPKNHGTGLIFSIKIDIPEGDITIECGIQHGKPVKEIEDEIRIALFGQHKHPFFKRDEPTDSYSRIDWERLANYNKYLAERKKESI